MPGSGVGGAQGAQAIPLARQVRRERSAKHTLILSSKTLNPDPKTKLSPDVGHTLSHDLVV